MLVGLYTVLYVLLSLEAWSFIKSGEQKTVERYHLHRWAVWFLVAVGVWNFLGAGVFGFLINLPVVSYYEIGTALTANHGHTAMMGVYGMLAVGLSLFALRYIIPPQKWPERMAKLCFWSLNIGLAWMVFATSVEYTDERASSGVVVKPTWLSMTRCTVPPTR